MSADLPAIATLAIGASAADHAGSSRSAHARETFAALFAELATAQGNGAPLLPPPFPASAAEEDARSDAASEVLPFPFVAAVPGLPFSLPAEPSSSFVPAFAAKEGESLPVLPLSLPSLGQAPASAAAADGLREGFAPLAANGAAGGASLGEESAFARPYEEPLSARAAMAQGLANLPPAATSPADPSAIAQAAMAPSHAAPHEPYRIAIDQPLDNARWAEAFGQRVSWFAQQGASRAELILNPPHLGRIEVSLTLIGDAASAQFASANPVVRDALEAAMPRLREILAEAGITLGQADIGAELSRFASPQENMWQAGSSPLHRNTPESAGAPSAGSLHLGGLRPINGFVDVFA